MARDPFGPDDLGTINLVLRLHPRVADLVRLVRRIGQQATYPITSFTALADALGGEEQTLPYGERDWSVADLGKIVPAYYFPIASEDDLVAKLVEVTRQRRERWLRHAGARSQEQGMARRQHRGGWGPQMAAQPWAAGWSPPPPPFQPHEPSGPPQMRHPGPRPD